MADKRCFVQFSHPGKEHGPITGRRWHKPPPNHRRKFMQLHGEWIDGKGAKRSGELWAWGEWEPESDIVCTFNSAGEDSGHPRRLWKPYYVPKNSYQGLHNTDPVIFGDRFLYSNCGQAASNKANLRNLEEGSVIAFGSGKLIDYERNWMLDTVLVVRDSKKFNMRRARIELEGWVPETFLEVVGGPLSDYDEKESCIKVCVPGDGCLRLYRGATPDHLAHGMFSFFPAIPAGEGMSFPRPASWQAVKGLRAERSCDELRELWESLVKQVRDAGLVLGTYAELPERRVE